MKFSPADQFEISSEVLSQEVNGETVLLDLQGESYFGLNEVGTRIWQLLQAGRSIRGLLDTLYDEYEASEDRLASDVDELLDKLTQSGLIQLLPAES
jgi:hypothetical protein